MTILDDHPKIWCDVINYTNHIETQINNYLTMSDNPQGTNSYYRGNGMDINSSKDNHEDHISDSQRKKWPHIQQNNVVDDIKKDRVHNTHLSNNNEQEDLPINSMFDLRIISLNMTNNHVATIKNTFHLRREIHLTLAKEAR